VKRFLLLFISFLWASSCAFAAADKEGGGSTSNPTSVVVPAKQSATIKVSFLSKEPSEIQLTKIGTSEVDTFLDSDANKEKVVQCEDFPQVWVITGHYKESSSKTAPWKPSPTKLWLDHDDRKVIGFEDTKHGTVQSSDYQYNSVVVTIDIRK
jgi:hypothetical protein